MVSYPKHQQSICENRSCLSAKASIIVGHADVFIVAAVPQLLQQAHTPPEAFSEPARPL